MTTRFSPARAPNIEVTVSRGSPKKQEQSETEMEIKPGLEPELELRQRYIQKDLF